MSSYENGLPGQESYMKKPLGSHKFLSLVACNRCGRKESWSPKGIATLREHIRECQPDLATAPLSLPKT